MASSRSRPPDPLERNGAQRARPSNERASAEHSEALHHSDDELFAARVSALIAERHRLQRQGLIHRLQHLKAAILSSELNDHHEFAHRQMLHSEPGQSDSRSQQPSSALLLRPSIVQHRSRNPAVLAPDASGCLREECTTERGSYPRGRVPPLHRGLKTDESCTSPAQHTEQVLSALTPFDHERLQVPLRRPSDSVSMHSSPTLAGGASGGITTPAPLHPVFPITRPSPDGVHPSTPSGTDSFTTQSSSSVNPCDAHTTIENLEAHEHKLPVTRLPSSGATGTSEYERTARSMDVAVHPIEASSSQEPPSDVFRMDEVHSDASQHSFARLPALDKTSDFRSSTNQTGLLRPEIRASYKPARSSPNRSFRGAITAGSINLISPLLSFEAQLFSGFVADITERQKSGKRCFRGTIAKYPDVVKTRTGSLVSRPVQRDPSSVSRPQNILYGDMQSSFSSLRLKDVLNPLCTYTSKLLTLSESATLGNLSASLSVQKHQSSGNIDVHTSKISTPSTAVIQPLTLLSMVFFDQELKSLIDKTFRLSYIPRDKSLLEAVRISAQISCIIDHQYHNSEALTHVVLSGQESQFLSNLYVEPQHPGISNSSTSPQWILDLQQSLGKVRIPVPANFQRRTFLNMSEHDERRAPTALWHFDNANSSQHADQLTDLSQAQTHVAYATATDTRRYSSYYSNQGVHSSPGDTTMALNFGFQTRTNYPFRKTYRYIQSRGEESHETPQTRSGATLSCGVLTNTEFSAQTPPAFQDGLFFDASNTGSALYVAGRIDDETPVYSISEEGKLIPRDDELQQ